jgi:nucleotide-binding universal stress UspA family protein
MRETGLHIVHAWLWPLFRVPLGGSPLAPPGAGLQARADDVLATAEGVARATAPDIVIETTLVVGDPAEELRSHARGSQLVVVGNRGLGGFTGLLLGSTGIALSAHSPRPVAVVRGTATTNGPVVVGIDDSAGAEDLMRSACREASLRGVETVAVHAWGIPLDLVPVAAKGYEKAEAQARTAGQELLDKLAATVSSEFADVKITTRVLDGSAAAAIVKATEGAQLVVMGSQDLGPLRGLLAGSTTHAVIHHSACPVLIHR